MSTSIDVMRFDTGEVELAYSEWPGESPPLVFLHGITGGRRGWEPRLALRGRQRAFAYDIRGHGDSGRAETYLFTDFGRDAVRFIEGVCGEPAILIGHSLGGLAAIYVAAERPDIVLGLLLVDPPLYVALMGPRDQKADFEQRRALAGKRLEEIVAGGIPEARAGSLPQVDANAVAQLLDRSAFEGWDTDALLRKVACPVLLEHGERGYASGLAASNLYEGEVGHASSLLRDCTVVEIKGSGHIPMVQQPEQFMKVATEFVQRLVAQR